MTPMAGRSVALIAALSSGFVLYRGSYLTAVALGGVAYVAFSSLKELPKERSAKRLVRSASAPELYRRSNKEEGSLRSVELLHSEEPLFQPRAPSPPPPSRVEKWGIDLSRGDRGVIGGGWLHLPTTRPEEKRRFPQVDLTTLPQRSTTRSEKITSLFGQDKLRPRDEIVDGIVDIADISSPLWQKVFPNQSLSLEVGDVEGAAWRTTMRGGAWAVITNDWSVAKEVQRGRENRGWLKPLIFRGRGWLYTHFYLDVLFKRIDFRTLKGAFPCVLEELRLLSSAIEVDGELRFIFRRGDQSNIDRCKQLCDQLSFAPPEELHVDEELVQFGLFGPKRTLSEQLHLIYRGVK